MCAPNLKSAALSDPEILRGPEISKLGTFPGRRLLAGQIVILGQEEPRIHVRTKFEQRSFIRSTDVEGVPKIRNSARTTEQSNIIIIIVKYLRVFEVSRQGKNEREYNDGDDLLTRSLHRAPLVSAQRVTYCHISVDRQ